MTAPDPTPKPRYNLRESDYRSTAMPGFLPAMALAEVTDKGLLYMIYREARRTRIMAQVLFTFWLVSLVLWTVVVVVAVVAGLDPSSFEDY